MAEERPRNPGESGDSELETQVQGESREELEEDSSTLPEAPEESPRATGRHFVVGIGASAGGLEALGELVKHVPLDNMSFVVVQHLAPHHDSVLPQLLSRTSKVEVQTAKDGTPARPNHVYVIPPNTD